MKTLYIDCGMGAAGDMLTGALLELLENPEQVISELNNLGIPKVEFKADKSVKCGITGTHISVSVNGEVEESNDTINGHDHLHNHHSHSHVHDHHEHNHEHGKSILDGVQHLISHLQKHEHSHDEEGTHDHNHEHNHNHSHSHNTLSDIEHIVRGHLPLSEKVKNDVMAIYELIAEAESHAHGVPVSEIHFHEVGTLDAVADITAVCVLMEKISPDQVIVSPVHVGSGKVKCAHGILPVPAPATAHILRDVPIYGGSIKGELCTPTGAAILKHFATSFSDMPVMKTQSIGYGMGKKDFEAANCVRILLGETNDLDDSIVELSCNIDDMTPEAVGFVSERLFSAGALDVFTIPIGMKKSRPGTLLCVMCEVSDREDILALIFKHTTTLGIREKVCKRYTLNREIKSETTKYGIVHKKISKGYGIVREKYEYEDIAEIARRENKSLSEIISDID